MPTVNSQRVLYLLEIPIVLKMMDSVNAFESDEKHCQWTIMIMNTRCKKNNHEWEHILTQYFVMKALSKENPSIVLFQECSCKSFEQCLQEDRTLPSRYKYMGQKEGASMIYNEDLFNVEKLSQSTIDNILLSEKLAGKKSEILKKSAETMYIAIVNLKNHSDIEFLCVSWHGPHKETPSTKIKYFTYFMEFLVQLQKEIGKEKKGKKLPIVVGGNFNIDINNAKFETVEAKKLFGTIMPYEASTCKIPFNGMRVSCKDFFVTTEDLKLETIGCMDLKEIKDHVSPEDIFDHHPILGYLSLRDNLRGQLQKAGVTDDQTISHHATNESSTRTKCRTDSPNDVKPVDKCCESPIMIMNTGRASKTPSGKMTSYRQMQLIKDAVLSKNPNIVLFQEFPPTNFQEDLTWQKDKILSRYVYERDNGKNNNTGIMYNQDMCVVKKLPPELKQRLISMFKEDVKTKFKEKVKRNTENKLPTPLKPAQRMCILKVKTSSEPHIKFVCVSWHGPHNISDNEKIDYIKCFLEFLQRLHKEIELPILVGGDFNISMDNEDFKTEVEKEFCIWRYEAPKRRQSLPTSTESLKRGRKSGVIDFFITTKELHLQENSFMALNKLKDFLSPEHIFRHVPVVGHIRWNKGKMPVKIYVGYLTSDTTEDDIRPLFERYGTVIKCDVLHKFAFVHMEKEDEANAAIKELTMTLVKGSKITVQKSTGNSEESGREYGGGKMSGGRGRFSSMSYRRGGYPRRGRSTDTDIDYSHNYFTGVREHPYSGNEYGRSYPYHPDDRRRGSHRDSLPMPRNYDIDHYEGPPTDYNRYRDYDGYDDPARHPTGTTLSYLNNRYYPHTMGWEPPGPTSQGYSSSYPSDRYYEPNPSNPWY